MKKGYLVSAFLVGLGFLMVGCDQGPHPFTIDALKDSMRKVSSVNSNIVVTGEVTEIGGGLILSINGKELTSFRLEDETGGTRFFYDPSLFEKELSEGDQVTLTVHVIFVDKGTMVGSRRLVVDKIEWPGSEA